MRADLQNNTASGVDDYGNPLPATWATLSTVACRVFSTIRREVIDGDKIVLVENIKGLFPLAADVSELYRIANVKDRLGTILYGGPLAIQTIQRRKDHQEVMLERIQS